MSDHAESSAGRTSLRHRFNDPQVRVALVAAVCLLAQAVIAKNILDVELDFFSQFAPMWVFLAYSLSGSRDPRSEIAFIAVIILVTVAILVLYAV